MTARGSDSLGSGAEGPHEEGGGRSEPGEPGRPSDEAGFTADGDRAADGERTADGDRAADGDILGDLSDFGDAADLDDLDDVGEPLGAEGLGGWVPPEQRAWRHPSELHGPGGGSGTAGLFPRADPGLTGTGGHPSVPALEQRAGLRRRGATIGVGAAAAVAVVVGVMLLLDAGSGPAPSAPGARHVGGAPVQPAAVDCFVTAGNPASGVALAMVALESSTGDGSTIGCGIGFAKGGLVVTTADAVAGVQQVRAVTATGARVTATVVASDLRSDVAVLSLPVNVPVAPIGGDANIRNGTAATTVAVVASHGRRAAVWTSATVRAVAMAVPRGDAAGMAGIAVSGVSLPVVAGEPLLDGSGKVVGILDPDGTAPAAGWNVFLPAEETVKVAGELDLWGRVRHGWLDLEAVDAVPGTSASPAAPAGQPETNGTPDTTLASVPLASEGAEVVSVEPGGAAAKALRPGDVIVALDGAPVRSMAELRSRLYVLPPGSRVQLAVLRSGSHEIVAVDLSASP